MATTKVVGTINFPHDKTAISGGFIGGSSLIDDIEGLEASGSADKG